MFLSSGSEIGGTRFAVACSVHRPADFVLHNIYRCFARRRFDPFARRKLVPREKWKKKTTLTLNYCTRRLIIYICIYHAYYMWIFYLLLLLLLFFYFSEHARSLRAAAILLSARPLTSPPPPFPPNTARPAAPGDRQIIG